MAGELRFRFLSLSSFYYYDLFLVRSMLSNNSSFIFIYFLFFLSRNIDRGSFEFARKRRS